MFIHTNPNSDPLIIATQLAQAHGVEVCLDCLATTIDEAGTLPTPPRDSGVLTIAQAVAIDAVLNQEQWRVAYKWQAICSPGMAVKRLRMVAWLASRVLPPSVVDYEGRYRLGLGDDGHWPSAESIEIALRAHVEALAGYLAEHDAGEWVDPNAASGALANVHDVARVLEALHEVAPVADEDVTA